MKNIPKVKKKKHHENKLNSLEEQNKPQENRLFITMTKTGINEVKKPRKTEFTNPNDSTF